MNMGVIVGCNCIATCEEKITLVLLVLAVLSLGFFCGWIIKSAVK